MAVSNDQAALNLAFTILLGSGIRSNANGGSVGRACAPIGWSRSAPEIASRRIARHR